jgi:hypothetical protein
MSPTASIRVGLLVPLANSISISVASGTSGSNPLSSSGGSNASLNSEQDEQRRGTSSPPGVEQIEVLEIRYGGARGETD